MIQNIAVFTNTLEKGGAEMQSVELAKVLSRNYNVWLVVFYGEQINQELLDRLQGYNVHLVRFSGRKIKCWNELIMLVKHNKIDCIYSFLATTNFYSGIIGKFIFPKLKTIGGIRSSVYKGAKLYLQRFLHNHILTLNISNNHRAVETLVDKGFKRNKFKVIHNVFPLPKNITTRTINNSYIQIVSVGRFVESKDYRTALRAIAQLKSNNRKIDFKYLVIGYGSLETDIRQMIKDLSLDDIVEIKINPNNIFEYLTNSDIYLSTSLFEGTSNSILEGMYAGLPIVATNVGDNSYMVKEDNGFLTDVKDVETITNCLSILLQDKELRAKMGASSENIVESSFSQTAFAENNFNLLKNL